MMLSTAFVALLAAAPALSAPVAFSRKSTVDIARRGVSFIPGKALNNAPQAVEEDVAEVPLEEIPVGDALLEEDQAAVDEVVQDEVVQDELVQDEVVQDEVVQDEVVEEIVGEGVQQFPPEILEQAEAIALDTLTQQIADERAIIEADLEALEATRADVEALEDEQALADFEAQVQALTDALAINDVQQQLLDDGLVVLADAAPEVDPALQDLLDRQAELIAELELIKQQIDELNAAGEETQQAEDLMAGAEEALADLDQQIDEAVVETGLDQDTILAELIARLQALTDAAALELVDANGGAEAADILALLDTATDDVAAAVDDLVANFAADEASLDDASVQNIIDLLATASQQALDLQAAVAGGVVDEEIVDEEIVDEEIVNEEIVDEEIVDEVPPEEAPVEETPVEEAPVEEDADVVADPQADLFEQLRQLLEQLRAQQGAVARRRRSLRK